MSLAFEGITMDEQGFIIEVIDDPEVNARYRAIHDQFRANADWLSNHWPDVLPQAYGKYVAVAGQQAFISEDPLEAERLASTAHPEDKGILVKYVSSFKGPRMYGSLRKVEN
jgi:hypothetical protein